MNGGIGKSFAIVLMAGCLCACGSVNGEIFVDGEAGNDGGDRYQRLVDSILADGQLTRAETEQAIEAEMSCYEEHGLIGDYGYDLDLYPWILFGSYGMSEDNPGAEAGNDSAISKAMGACNAIFFTR
ncbi:hypothetical protein [Bifidobacterium avesanii]|uniref:Uncharacterized protein n=1 Tax=Bifidobacterium avesanii TaxID=1798157 RepID=A0A7K3TER3_9BIFI|nr:hypothetical protein [Bifidobacterium avesanii]KAB8295573.1 hypothetical protein DSM100685_0183 [Bifidobacterium avesanii]NEG77577.1 hypothetical protein [Bifidobacterium avesanii]